MRMKPTTCFALVLAAVMAVGIGPATGGESRHASLTAVSDLTVQSDPCGFYRGQAYGRGLSHLSTEMLWACEAIAVRRAAAMDLSERLMAVELALDRYRQAVISAGASTFAHERSRRTPAKPFGAGDAVKAALAESTGLAAALDAVRHGF